MWPVSAQRDAIRDTFIFHLLTAALFSIVRVVSCLEVLPCVVIGTFLELGSVNDRGLLTWIDVVT